MRIQVQVSFYANLKRKMFFLCEYIIYLCSDKRKHVILNCRLSQFSWDFNLYVSIYLHSGGCLTNFQMILMIDDKNPTVRRSEPKFCWKLPFVASLGEGNWKVRPVWKLKSFGNILNDDLSHWLLHSSIFIILKRKIEICAERTSFFTLYQHYYSIKKIK